MKLITVEKIKDFIESKHGAQEVNKVKVIDRNGTLSALVIHNKGTECPEFKVRDNNWFMLNSDDNVHCVLHESDISDFDKAEPFVKFREAMAGALVIDGQVPTEDELEPYIYKI